MDLTRASIRNLSFVELTVVFQHESSLAGSVFGSSACYLEALLSLFLMVISTGKCSGSGTVNKSALESLNQVFCLRVKPSQNLKEFYVANKGKRKW